MTDPILGPPCAVCDGAAADTELCIANPAVCDSCWQQLPRCAYCRTPSVRLTRTADEAELCVHCLTGWARCVSCQELTGPQLRIDTDDPVCARCASVLFAACFNCGRFTADSRYISGGHRACPRCATRFRACPACGTLVQPGHRCDGCATRGKVWNYTYRPDPRFHGTGPLYLGLELEIIVPEHRFDTCATLATDHLGGLGYLKRDSSIRPSGFELVSHPMSYRYAIESFPWPLLDQLHRLGCEADASVGLHVHASRAGFDNPAHVYRWLKLLYRNEEAVTRLARRRTHYAQFDSAARARARQTAKGPQHALGLERYQAINPLPPNTLEVRVFASSLNLQQVQAALAFTAASIDYTRGLRIADIRAGAWDWARFATWVTTRPHYRPLAAEMEALQCAC